MVARAFDRIMAPIEARRATELVNASSISSMGVLELTRIFSRLMGVREANALALEFQVDSALRNSALGGGAPFSPDSLPNLAAWFKHGQGITVVTGVSQWNDASGNARHLKQATLGSQPALQGDNSILFDGVDDFLKCDAFTLNQPFTVYIPFKQISWASADYVMDGNTNSTAAILQRFSGASPQLEMYAGTNFGNDSGLPIGTYGVVVAVFNGANSFFGINLGAGASGGAGAQNAAGFTLGARGSGGSSFCNIQVKGDILVYTGTHDASTRALVVAYLQGFF